jgi:hypothetical protein
MMNAFQANQEGLGCSETQRREFRYLSQCLCDATEKVKIKDWASDQGELTCKIGIKGNDQYLRTVRISLSDHSVRCSCPKRNSEPVLCAHVVSIMMLKVSDEVADPGFKECVLSVAKSFVAAIPQKDRSKYTSKLARFNRYARTVLQEMNQPCASQPITNDTSVAADGGDDDDASSLASTQPLKISGSPTGGAADPSSPSPPLDGPAAAADAAAVSAAGTPDIDSQRAKRRRTVFSSVGDGGVGGISESSAPSDGTPGPPDAWC